MRTLTTLLATCLCLAVLAGCGVTPPARFYILTPAGNGMAQTQSGPALGIGPIDFPAYLDRPEIAHRSGDNMLYFAQSDRWAEPLKTTFSHTLAENLSAMIPTDQVSIYPWTRSTRIDYQVSVDVTRFDADADGTVILAASWKIIRAEDGRIVSRDRKNYTRASGGLVYPAVVAALSRTLEELSHDIAASITALSAR
ncbi:MAG TPA: PqiC family protein [Gammaproteobacteria bacterium]|nr:PqiC family protein [Gammaproteobacteria bacterium]